MNDLLPLIDELERLVESGAFMGKRMVNEEAFFTQTQRLRAALSRHEVVRTSSKAANDFIAAARLLTEPEQLQIVAALAQRLAQQP